MNKYRSRLEIIRDILTIAVEEGGTKKTRIMYGANLSYRLVTQYLDIVIKAGLLKYDGKSTYTITCRGKEFLELYEIYEKKNEKLRSHLNELKNGRETLNKMLTSGENNSYK